MCSPLPRGAHEAAGTQAGRQTAATPCMGSSGAVGTESRKKLTILEGEVEACTHELDL